MKEPTEMMVMVVNGRIPPIAQSVLYCPFKDSGSKNYTRYGFWKQSLWMGSIGTLWALYAFAFTEEEHGIDIHAQDESGWTLLSPGRLPYG